MLYVPNLSTLKGHQNIMSENDIILSQPQEKRASPKGKGGSPAAVRILERLVFEVHAEENRPAALVVDAPSGPSSK